MRARFVLVALGTLLTRESAAAPFQCGTPGFVRQPNAAFMGIDCSTRPQLASALTSGTHPITVHYDPADAALAQVVLDAAETAWTVTTGPLGFEAPPPDGTGGGDANFDFYLEVSQFGGYFCPEAATPATDRTGYFGWVSLNPDAFDAASMPAVVAHELNHASQLGIDVIETPAFMEMTSAYVMEKVFDSVNLAAPFIAYFQASPESALDYYVYAEPYQYGASLFLFWLFDEKLGNPSLASQVWNDAKQVYDPGIGNDPDFFDVIDDMAAAQGASLEEWYREFAADRWFNGPNADGTFTEGATYAAVTPEANHAWDALPGGNRTGGPVGELGTSYLQIGGNGAPAGAQVRFHFEGDPSTTWSLLLLRGSDGSRAPLALDASGEAIVDVTAGYNVIAVVNEGDANKDPDGHYGSNDWDESTFTWSAEHLSDPGTGCGCALAGGSRSTLAPLALLALSLLLRKRCA